MENIKNILITGGAGFIGSHVVDAMLKAGYMVRIMDNLGPPTHNGVLPNWLDKKAEFFSGDVSKKEDWRKALQGIDAVMHLASYMDYHLDFSTYVRYNIESVALLFELIVEEKLPIKKIVSASSQSVYGEGKYNCPKHGLVYPKPRSEDQLSRHEWNQVCQKCGTNMDPLPELEDDFLNPLIPYGISKWSSEQLLSSLGKRYNIPTVSLRYSIVLGPRQSFRHFYSGALRAFAVNVLNNEPISMNEDARQFRDFVHVCDVANAHRVVLEDAGADFQVFNVGSGIGTQVVELAKTLAEVAGVEFKPFLSNRYRVGDARNSLMDNTKLKNLGWLPQKTLHEAVFDYWIWIKQFENLSEILKKNYEQLSKEGILKT